MQTSETDCNCIESINHELRKQGKELDLVFFLTGSMETRPRVPVNYVDKRPRGAPKHPHFIIDYCPFCGRKYRDGEDRDTR